MLFGANCAASARSLIYTIFRERNGVIEQVDENDQSAMTLNGICNDNESKNQTDHSRNLTGNRNFHAQS